MKNSSGKMRAVRAGKDTMRPEYDFSKAVRGATAARYAEGTNVVLLDPDVAEIFRMLLRLMRHCVPRLA
jgi:hypothetical protein